jgi:2Fe-2S ferredoxin
LSEFEIAVVDRSGAPRALEARGGEVLMHLLRDQIDVTIGACGGVLSCGTCLVILDEESAAHLPPPGPDEQELLEALDAPPAARLACQLVLTDADAVLRLAIAREA